MCTVCPVCLLPVVYWCCTVSAATCWWFDIPLCCYLLPVLLIVVYEFLSLFLSIISLLPPSGVQRVVTESILALPLWWAPGAKLVKKCLTGKKTKVVESIFAPRSRLAPRTTVPLCGLLLPPFLLLPSSLVSLSLLIKCLKTSGVFFVCVYCKVCIGGSTSWSVNVRVKNQVI